ncbi:MAG: MoaD/ThiS family protein [Saccharolobus sp.]|uniref:MoaD/ThiS family protein n=1 Tax=Saccharolobus sp. TaxID=2100761 RepID=UPI003174777E
MVKIRIYGILRVYIGSSEVEVDAKNIREACEKICEIFGNEIRNLIFDKNGNIYPSILIFKRNERVTSTDILVDPDTIIHIIPAIEGG